MIGGMEVLSLRAGVINWNVGVVLNVARIDKHQPVMVLWLAHDIRLYKTSAVP